jgi:LPS-assembly protein
MKYLKPLFCSLFLPLFFVLFAAAQQPENIERKVSNPIGEAEEEKRSLRQTKPQQVSIIAQIAPTAEEKLVIYAENQEKVGDVGIAIGNVQVLYGDIVVIADRATYNEVTGDLIAEGNVFFEQQGQRIAGDKLEINAKTKRGTITTATAFTNRTPDGTVLIIDALRADKTGADTYRLENAMMTACQEANPKWSFTAKRARIRLDDQAEIYNALFRIKNFPVFYLPYASFSINKKDRASGFLLPSSGSSTIKGRTLQTAYFQTLGRSADLLVRTDLYSKRGLGVGFDFRARTDENSYIMLGSFMVFDRLFGEKGPDQGGSSFYADAVQHFKNGFVAVADVNITSSFTFRQIFSDNLQTAISPEERTLLYLNKNWGSFSFNTQFSEQSSLITELDEQGNVVDSGKIVKVRKFPSIEISQRSTKVSESLPFYFSFDTVLQGVRRSETSGDRVDLKTPSAVQRLGLSPRLTFPLRSFAGFTLTPSIGLSSTFYSDSLDPVQRQVVGQNLFRTFANLELDLRPPALAKIYRHNDGQPWFKHVIEPFILYRRIKGIDEFDRTIRIDELDAIADTNEITYGVSNSILIRRPSPDGLSTQPHELLNLTFAQKYFFDPTFGGALQEGVRNQFFPLNTLSGFAYGGIKRNQSPVNVRARLRPTQLLFADLRFNYDTQFNSLRDVIFGGGVAHRYFSISQFWYHTRRVEVEPSKFDPTTLPGNQIDLSAFVGNPGRGPYGGLILSYDLRDRQFNNQPRNPNVALLTTSAGWAWDCCSVVVQNVNYNIGFRNENRIVFAFTLKGIGTIGTETFGQLRRRP